MHRKIASCLMISFAALCCVSCGPVRWPWGRHHEAAPAVATAPAPAAKKKWSLWPFHKSSAETSSASAPAPKEKASTKPDATPDRQKIVAATGRKDIEIVTVPARGFSGAALDRAVSLSFGQTGISENVLQRLKEIHHRGVTAYVGGPSPERSGWALKEALSHCPPRSLPGLIIYTDAPITDSLKDVSRRAGASILNPRP